MPDLQNYPASLGSPLQDLQHLCLEVRSSLYSAELVHRRKQPQGIPGSFNIYLDCLLEPTSAGSGVHSVDRYVQEQPTWWWRSLHKIRKTRAGPWLWNTVLNLPEVHFQHMPLQADRLRPLNNLDYSGDNRCLSFVHNQFFWLVS